MTLEKKYMFGLYLSLFIHSIKIFKDTRHKLQLSLIVAFFFFFFQHNQQMRLAVLRNQRKGSYVRERNLFIVLHFHLTYNFVKITHTEFVKISDT